MLLPQRFPADGQRLLVIRPCSGVVSNHVQVISHRIPQAGSQNSIGCLDRLADPRQVRAIRQELSRIPRIIRLVSQVEQRLRQPRQGAGLFLLVKPAGEFSQQWVDRRPACGTLQQSQAVQALQAELQRDHFASHSLLQQRLRDGGVGGAAAAAQEDLPSQPVRGILASEQIPGQSEGAPQVELAFEGVDLQAATGSVLLTQVAAFLPEQVEIVLHGELARSHVGRQLPANREAGHQGAQRQAPAL